MQILCAKVAVQCAQVYMQEWNLGSDLEVDDEKEMNKSHISRLDSLSRNGGVGRLAWMKIILANKIAFSHIEL